jgi:hypothetical protein
MRDTRLSLIEETRNVLIYQMITRYTEKLQKVLPARGSTQKGLRIVCVSSVYIACHRIHKTSKEFAT